MNRQGKLLLILGAVSLLYLLARSDKGSAIVTDILTSGTRGIRNNNPGNIRLSKGTVWQGQVPPSEQTDTAFVQFTDALYGIRAMARILRNYFARGVSSVRAIVSTWAPSNENDTESYIAAVSNALGVSPETTLSTNQLPQLIAAIIKHENGKQPYPADVINRGISMS